MRKKRLVPLFARVRGCVRLWQKGRQYEDTEEAVSCAGSVWAKVSDRVCKGISRGKKV